jgi:hypothetical protein
VSEHTPGPWRIYRITGEDGESIGVMCINEQHIDSDGDPSDICEIANLGYYGIPQCEANAKLIAAAPELLAALQAMLKDCEQSCETSLVHGGAVEDMARSAIAKATG